MEQTIQISEELVSKAEAALTKVNKRAAKLGLPPFTITFSKVYLKEDNVPLGARSGADGTQQHWAVVDATVTGEQPKYEGWRLLARVSNEAGAAIIAEVPNETVPADQRERLGLCDHCGKKRNRTATFVIGHDDGSIKQVGRQCLADFLGSRGETATSIANWLAYLEMLLNSVSLLGEEGGWGGGSEGPRAYEVNWYLSQAAKVIGAEGWRPSAQGIDATKNDVWDFLACNGKDFPKYGIPREKYEKFMAIEVDEEEIHNVTEWALGANGNTYMDNIAEVASAGIVTRKTNGLMASVIATFRKQAAEKAAWMIRNEEALKSRFVGTVGERVRDLKVVITDMRFFDSYYGTTILYKMVDADGNRFGWFSSSGSIGDAVGETVTITGTVKDHKVYKDIEETMLTRCKVSG